MMDRMRRDILVHGYGWTAAEIAATGACIGFVGLHDAEIEPLVPAGTIEIGWRLAPEFWGFGYVTEAAEALLDFGFETLGREGNHLLCGVEQSTARRQSWNVSA